MEVAEDMVDKVATGTYNAAIIYLCFMVISVGFWLVALFRIRRHDLDAAVDIGSDFSSMPTDFRQL
jgi:hypothetical protein